MSCTICGYKSDGDYYRFEQREPLTPKAHFRTKLVHVELICRACWKWLTKSRKQLGFYNTGEKLLAKKDRIRPIQSRLDEEW